MLDGFEEEVLAPFPMAQALEPGAAKDRPPRPQSFADALDGRPGTEREAAEIEVGKAQKGDQLAEVSSEDSRG